MSLEQDVRWQPIDRLDYVLGLVRGMTEETRGQRDLFRQAAVITLDSETMIRTRRAYADRLDLIALFREQLGRWGKAGPSRQQTDKIENVKALLDEDERLSREILHLVGYVDPGWGGKTKEGSRVLGTDN